MPEPRSVAAWPYDPENYRRGGRMLPTRGALPVSMPARSVEATAYDPANFRRPMVDIGPAVMEDPDDYSVEIGRAVAEPAETSGYDVSVGPATMERSDPRRAALRRMVSGSPAPSADLSGVRRGLHETVNPEAIRLLLDAALARQTIAR